MSTVTRTAAVALVALAVALMGATAAFAQSYPPGQTAVLSESVVAPGGDIVCAASGFQAGATVTAVLDGTNFTDTATVTADADGNASVTFQIPADAEGGTATCTLSGPAADGDFTRVASATFTIDETLPATGGEFTRGGALAAGIIILGAAMVLIARRKSSADLS